MNPQETHSRSAAKVSASTELESVDEMIDRALFGARSSARRENAEVLIAGLELRHEGAREEAWQLTRLHAALDELRTPVDPDFTDAVMRRVATRSRSVVAPWLVAAAVLTVLLSLTVWLAGGQGSGGAASTLADMALAAVTAGAGLLGASWKGVGTIAGSWLQASPVTFFATLAAVVGAQLLLLRRLRRARRATAEITRNS